MIKLSDEELVYLRANYGRITNSEIAAKLYVAEGEIYYLAKRYGIEPVPRLKESRRTTNRSNYSWTSEDHKLFVMMTDEGYTYQEIAAVLHRTVGSVRSFKHNYYPDYPSPRRQSGIRRKMNKEE